jgi:hypothetical protein
MPVHYPPEVFWHYTSADAFLNIVATKTVWATHTSHLVDSTEGKTGPALLADIADRYAKELVDADDRQTLQALAAKLRTHRVDCYVACFSEATNRLDNWRSFVPSGRGVALGFDRGDFSGFCGIPIEKIIYTSKDPDWKKPGAEYWPGEFQRLLQLAPVRAASVGSERADVVLLHLSEWRKRSAPIFKHGAFTEEREWRLFLHEEARSEKTPLRFRTGTGGVVPYVEVAWPPHALKKVMLGPGLQTVSTERAVRQLLDRNNLVHVKLESSDIPWQV